MTMNNFSSAYVVEIISEVVCPRGPVLELASCMMRGGTVPLMIASKHKMPYMKRPGCVQGNSTLVNSPWQEAQKSMYEQSHLPFCYVTCRQKCLPIRTQRTACR
jgi:hypothetical protein